MSQSWFADLHVPSIGFAGVPDLTVVLTTLCAYASWHLVEKRAIQLKPWRPATAPSS